MEKRDKVIEMLEWLNEGSLVAFDSFSIDQLAALVLNDVKELIKDLKAEEKTDLRE